MPLIKYNNQSLSSITALPSGVPSGKLKLISSQTASNSASISFTSGLTSTYKAYKFVWINCHPSTDANFTFNGSTDSGSNYNVTKTTTVFIASHQENDASTSFQYRTAEDLAQSTSFQRLTNYDIDTDNDSATSGSLILFNPSSTTYVKHFISNCNQSNFGYSVNTYVAGYMNTTSAVNSIQFKMSAGNIDAGTIYLYAIDNS